MSVLISMERKPQQQTLSIRVSDTLRDFLERSKQVISSTRGESVSISDVAKTLLESAKDDRLDDRLEVAELGKTPTESMIAVRKKWQAGTPRSRAEWIFLAQYIQVACEELTEDPLAPGAEVFVALLEALLAVRALRTQRGTGLDRYYLGNLESGSVWNERTLDPDIVPRVVGKLIEDIRAAGSGKNAVGVGRNFYVAVRDEELPGMAALNAALDPFMPTLFRMAARGHWIRERNPVWLPREDSLLLASVPPFKRGGLRIDVQRGQADVNLVIAFDSRDVTYVIATYPQVREFATMLATLVPGSIWKGKHFLALSAQPGRYQFGRTNDGVTLGFNEEQWQELRSLFADVMTDPALQAIFGELSWIYGEI